MNYINGEITPNNTIPAYDLGFLRGAGIFQYFRTYNKYPFELQERLRRLFSAAKETNIQIKETPAEITAIIQTLIDATPDDVTIRIIATKGISEDTLTPQNQDALYILTKPLPALSQYENGIDTITTPLIRTLPHLKTLNYFPAILALEKAPHAKEALYLTPNQELLEGTTSNFFAIKGDTLITSNSPDILPGVTRKVLIELASPHYAIEYRNLPLKELPEIDEAFLTSSIKEIVPINRIDDSPIKNGAPGLKTQKLHQLFRESIYRLCRA